MEGICSGKWNKNQCCSYNFKTITFKADDIGRSMSHTQVPLVSCYAITVHKSQPMTINKGVLDLSSRVFHNACSLEYVAISHFQHPGDFLLLDYTLKSIIC